MQEWLTCVQAGSANPAWALTSLTHTIPADWAGLNSTQRQLNAVGISSSTQKILHLQALCFFDAWKTETSMSGLMMTIMVHQFRIYGDHCDHQLPPLSMITMAIMTTTSGSAMITMAIMATTSGFTHDHHGHHDRYFRVST